MSELCDMIRAASERRPQCRAIAFTLGATGNCCQLEDGHDGDHMAPHGFRFKRAETRSLDIHDGIVQQCKCTKHKRYTARRQPRIQCAGCWRLWILTHPDTDLETRWMR